MRDIGGRSEGNKKDKLRNIILWIFSYQSPCWVKSVFLSWRPPAPIRWFSHGSCQYWSILVAFYSHCLSDLSDGNGFWGCQPRCISLSCSHYGFIIIKLFPYLCNILFTIFTSLFSFACAMCFHLETLTRMTLYLNGLSSCTLVLNLLLLFPFFYILPETFL